MLFKPDWLETKQRLTDFWNGKYIGRPCLAIYAPDPKPDSVVPEKPLSDRDLYLNIDVYLKNLWYRFSNTAYIGEALPSDAVMAGYTISYGAKVKFNPETVWIEPIENLDVDNESLFELDFNSPELKQFFDFYTKFAQAGSGKFLIGSPAILPGHDLLSMLMGSEKFMLTLMDKPVAMKSAIMKLARNWVILNKKINDIYLQYQEGYGVCWHNLWGPYSFVSTQSDISCMLSREMFEQFVLDEIKLVGKEFGWVIYHLDGPGALHHVDTLCKVPEIKIIQWTPGAGNTLSVEKWLPLYKKIQDAGKIVMAHIMPEEVEFFIKHLDAKLSYICTRTRTKRDAEILLTKVEKLCRSQ